MTTPAIGKSRLELAVDLVKALAWPLIALTVLISFWSPLRAVARQLPDIVNRSETITIAGLSIKVREGLRRQATPEIARALANVTPDGLKRLLNTSSLSCWGADGADFGRKENAELIRLGLVEEVPKAELCSPQPGQDYVFGARPTALGRETQTFLLAVISEFAQEIARKDTQSP
jgi:hypothetical protein